MGVLVQREQSVVGSGSICGAEYFIYSSISPEQWLSFLWEPLVQHPWVYQKDSEWNETYDALDPKLDKTLLRRGLKLTHFLTMSPERFQAGRNVSTHKKHSAFSKLQLFGLPLGMESLEQHTEDPATSTKNTPALIWLPAPRPTMNTSRLRAFSTQELPLGWLHDNIHTLQEHFFPSPSSTPNTEARRSTLVTDMPRRLQIAHGPRFSSYRANLNKNA